MDPSIANLAYATPEAVTGLVQIPGLSGTKKYIRLAQGLLDLCRAGPMPLTVFIEGYSFGSQFQAHQLGELGGIIRYLLLSNGIGYVEVQPSMLKKFVTGKGNARKDEMRLGVFKHWAREFRTDHEVDAYGLARVGVAFCGDLQGLTAYQVEVVEKLKAKTDDPR